MLTRLKVKAPYVKEIKLEKTLHTNQYFISKLFSQIQKGYSPIVIICGKQRVGKSFIGVWLCMLMMSLYNKRYDPTMHTFYDPIKSTESIDSLNKVPLMIDEAGSILSKREWYSKTHAVLDTAVQTAGYKSLLWIFISPFTSDIDKLFVKHFDFQLKVVDRGHYKAFQINKRYDQFTNEKAISRLFLDDVRLNLKDVDNAIWQRYLKYSKTEKKKMRILKIKKVLAKTKKDTPRNLSYMQKLERELKN